eukprot:g9130.t1 g9130   contig35:102288-103016(-)
MNIRSVALLLATSRSVVAFAPSSSSVSVGFGSVSSRVGYSIVKQQPLTVRNMATKAGVATPSELSTFVSTAGPKLLVVDVRHPDPAVEPGDVKSLAVAGFPDKEKGYRPQAVNLPWSRESNSMELPDVDKDTPIITHCGGGGRGQKGKEYLMENGFTNVMNGGGPKETECWAEFGDK